MVLSIDSWPMLLRHGNVQGHGRCHVVMHCICCNFRHVSTCLKSRGVMAWHLVPTHVHSDWLKVMLGRLLQGLEFDSWGSDTGIWAASKFPLSAPTEHHCTGRDQLQLPVLPRLWCQAWQSAWGHHKVPPSIPVPSIGFVSSAVLPLVTTAGKAAAIVQPNKAECTG